MLLRLFVAIPTRSLSIVFAGFVILSGVLGTHVGEARAATPKEWVASGGNFSTASNWSPSGAPNSSNYVRFQNAFSGTVSLSNNVTTDNLSVEAEYADDPAANVTFDMNGNVWTVNTTAGQSHVGSYNDFHETSDRGNLTVLDGRLTVNDSLRVEGNSSLTVGAGGRFTTPSLIVDFSSKLNLTTATSQVEVGNLIIGGTFQDRVTFPNGRLTVAGSTKFFRQNLGPLSIGGGTSSQHPTFVLADGANVYNPSFGDGITAVNVGGVGPGTIEVKNGSMFNSVGIISIGGSTTGAGTITVDGGAGWDSDEIVRVGWAGTGTLNVTDGGYFNAKGFVVGGIGGSPGTVNLGANSSLISNSYLDVGNVGNGTLSIGAGAVVYAHKGRIAGTSGYAGAVVVDGHYEVIGTGANGGLYVGGLENDPGGQGTLDVRNGGELLVTGILKVWPTGKVTVASGGSINAGSWDVRGTLINNGTIASPVVANANSLLRGSGTYTSLTINNGGAFSPGNSPGTASSGTTYWSSGGTYVWEINQLADSIGVTELGNNPGWDLWNTGTLSIGSSFNIELRSLGLSDDDPAALSGWNAETPRQWLIATSTNGAFSAGTLDDLLVDATAFDSLNPMLGGTFSLASANANNELYLVFTPIPEPGSLMLASAGLIGLLAGRRRLCRPAHVRS